MKDYLNILEMRGIHHLLQLVHHDVLFLLNWIPEFPFDPEVNRFQCILGVRRGWLNAPGLWSSMQGRQRLVGQQADSTALITDCTVIHEKSVPGRVIHQRYFVSVGLVQPAGMSTSLV